MTREELFAKAKQARAEEKRTSPIIGMVEETMRI